jgi:hypothetical protein
VSDLQHEELKNYAQKSKRIVLVWKNCILIGGEGVRVYCNELI